MTTKVKYRDILESLAKMSGAELDQDATIFLSGSEECHPIEGLEQWSEMNGTQLDDGHWFFWAIA